MPGAADVLTSQLATMTVVTTPQPGGFAFDSTIAPKPGTIDVTEILRGAVDLTFLTKDVRFTDSNLEPSLAPAALGPKITDVLASVGVAGLIGQLVGSLPLLDKSTLSVAAEVTWRVLNERDEPLANDQWSATRGTVEDTPGGRVVRGADITVAFLPEVVELTANDPAPAPATRKLRAHVKLTAGTATVERDLPDIPVLVPRLAIPKVLAAFLHSNFQARDGDDDGGVLVMVPGNSPLRSVEQLNSTLRALQAAVTSIKSLGSFAATLAGIDELVGALSASPYFAFAATDAISDLNDTTLIERSFWKNNTELEDELSSMIFLGPAGRRVDCFCETDFDDENGHFRLTIGPNHVTVVRSLHSDDPVSEPAGMVEVVEEPSSFWSDPNFGDWLSGLRFL